MVGSTLQPQPQQPEQQQQQQPAATTTMTPITTTIAAAAAASSSYPQAAESFSCDEGIDALGMGRFQVAILAMAGSAWMADAAEMMLISFIKPAVQCEWGVDDLRGSLISSAVGLGTLVGAVVGGQVADIYGRRAGFLLTGVLTFTAGLLSALAPSYGWLVLARFCCGGGLGGVPVVFSLAMEFLPSDQRGRWGIGFLLFWSVGGMLEAALAWGIMLQLGWRWQVGLTAVPAGLMLLVWPVLPESPRWLLAQARREEAHQVLRLMARWNGGTLPPGQLRADCCHPVADHEGGGKARSSDDDAGTVAAMARGTIDGAAGGGGGGGAGMPEGGGQHGVERLELGSMRDLLMPGVRRLTLLLWYVWLCGGGVYYGMILVQPDIIGAEHSGERCPSYGLLAINTQPPPGGGGGGGSSAASPIPLGLPPPPPSYPLNASASSAAAAAYGGGGGSRGATPLAGDDDGLLPATSPRSNKYCAQQLTSDDYAATFVSASGELPGILLMVYIIDRIGRRATIGWGATICAAVFVLLVPCTSFLAETALIWVGRGVAAAFFQAIYVYTSELYPSTIRTTAMGVGAAFARLGLLLTPLIAQYIPPPPHNGHPDRNSGLTTEIYLRF
jgi:MFS family permease